jgi:beta-mannosidase
MNSAIALDSGWEIAAGAAEGLAWAPVRELGTVGASLGVELDTPHGRYDAQDWWYRCRFSAPAPRGVDRLQLRFDGLAGLADVWLNDEPVLSTRNMFTTERVDVTGRLRPDNELRIRFRSLDGELAARKPRPRWKTALVDAQNLRWVRTTLLGRIPGWTPPIHPVGVWKPVWLETVSPGGLASIDLQCDAEAGVARLRLSAALTAGSDVAEARLRIGDQTHALALDGDTLSADLRLPDVALWWPHTHTQPHGTPALHDCAIELRQGTHWTSIDRGRIGFRQVEVRRDEGRVQFQINGTPVFCRGACWTTDDFLRLHGDPGQLRRTLTLARDGGLNMLRIGGTMTYESDAFYALCDELGILVWQDFMFANMDYPVADEAFRAEIEREADQQLARLQAHPCIAAYCGGSEVEQQAAMLGLPASEWSNDFFSETLPARCAARHAGVPYFRSSPCEGALPFHVGVGISHYYGVGAYRRPVSDAKHAGVKFTTECLGFSHVPEPETIELLAGQPTIAPHHPLWKQRQPRDNGAGWDFEDIRDHYLRELTGLDPVALRSTDIARYLALSRTVTGEVLKRVFAEWRAPGSVCGGGLVWFLKDLWPGAGWGLIDSTGRPKAVYWALKRAWAARTVLITDGGLDGLQLQVHNEGGAPFAGSVEFTLYQDGQVRTAGGSLGVMLAANESLALQADALVGHFADTAYAYRFGPPQHDVAVARLKNEAGETLAEDFHFPHGLNLPPQRAGALTAQAVRLADGSVELTLESMALIQSLHIECAGYAADDLHFHLAPQSRRTLRLRPLDAAPRKFKAHLGALNLRETVTVRAD